MLRHFADGSQKVGNEIAKMIIKHTDFSMRVSSVGIASNANIAFASALPKSKGLQTPEADWYYMQLGLTKNGGDAVDILDR